MDRLKPRERPRRLVVGRQTWSDFLIAHWKVPVEAVRRHVPARLSIDTFRDDGGGGRGGPDGGAAGDGGDGHAWIGLLPFRMTNVRPPLVPPPLGMRFLETNVRTYVHVDGEEPGIFFFSLDAESLLAVAGARAITGLPYFHAQMSLRRDGDDFTYDVRRRSPTAPWLHARWTAEGAPFEAQPGTLEFFLAERYALYVEHGALWRGRVHHRPYPLRRARAVELEGDLVSSRIAEAVGPPAHVMASDGGFDVEIFRFEKV